MSKNTCKDCLHCSIENADEVYCSGMPWHYPFGGSDTVTLDREACEHFLERDKPTLFDRIATTPETLAEKLVYKTICVAVNRVTYSCWKSTITDESYRTKEEALAATVERLKEVVE